jgi:hypothetical protein
VALRAFALDEAVRQEHFLDRVVRLLDLALGDQAVFLQRDVDLLAEHAVFVRIGRIVVVERHAEAVEVALVLGHTRSISCFGVRPSFSARSMIGVPCVSSAPT